MMDQSTQLREDTLKWFETVNFSELNDRWIDEVINYEFMEAEENAISLSILFINDPLHTLTKIADICCRWCEIEMVNESAVSDDLSTSVNEEILWKILDTIDVNVKHIQGMIYLLCSRAIKADADVKDSTLGLASAKVYFNLIRVPGSGAYSVYHPSLLMLCIDCFPTPDFTADKNSGVRDFEKLSGVYTSALLSLIPVLGNFYLGNDPNILDHIIKKLAEAAACEILNPINFTINFLELGERELRRRYRPTFIISTLAYQAFLAILSTDLNGDKDKNCLHVLSYLSKHILCQKAKKSSTVSQKVHMIKDNAVAFICYNLVTHDFCSEATQVIIKRLCLSVLDKTDIRSIVSLAIVTILFKMQPESLSEMLEWILLFVDSSDAKDRGFAVDILGQLLNKTYGLDPSCVPESLTDNSVKIPIVFAILTRCDDVSPSVRAKSLAILSHNMKCILDILDQTKDQGCFEIEDYGDVSEKDVDINGNHRFFWYNLTSLRERLNEIAAILQRRVEDVNGVTRKAALMALENLLVFDHTYITEENLRIFDSSTKDSNITIRCQVMQSLSFIVDAHPDNTLIQECWVKCIFPLVLDAENTVQTKALSILKEQFLHKMFSSNEAHRESVFILLKMLSSGDFLAYQRYLQKCFSFWKAENVLKPQAIIQLEKYIGTEWEGCIWFYISNFAMYSTLPLRVSNLCVEHFEEFNGSNPIFMEFIMKILSHVYGSLQLEISEKVRCIVSDSLKSFSVPVELIPLYIELLYKIHKYSNNESEFVEFSVLVLQKCDEHLTEIELAKSFPKPPSEELLARYFCSIKEFCHHHSSNITPNVISHLKTFSACVQPSRALSKILSPALTSHAFTALGKISLQDELLAKDLLPIFAKELLTSKYDVIRNSIVIILIEMCKRYTSFADKYIPLISLCFKDKLYLIRHQTILRVINLLQEGYIKWRGPLFFCILSTLVDTKEAIQELGRYSLSLLDDKKKNIFSEHFIDSIFVFNNFPPPDKEPLGQTVKDLQRFSLPGEHKRKERLCLYTFLLDALCIKEIYHLVQFICEILKNIAQSVYPLNETTECIIRDCFAILTCKEIRAVKPDEYDKVDEEREVDMLTAELNTRKIAIVEPVIPVIAELKDGITDPESDLMRDLIIFLKELLYDYKDSLKDILAGNDKLLLRQIELEFKNDAEKERTKEKRIEKELKDKRRQSSTEEVEHKTPVTLQGIQTMIEDVSVIVEQDKEIVNKKRKDDLATSQLTPKIPLHIKHAKKHQRSVYTEIPSTSRPSTSTGISQQTYNIAASNPAEAVDIARLQSTPRVVLTPVKIPLTTNILNISAIENMHEPMSSDESDEDML